MENKKYYKHSQQTKQKLSQIRKQYLKDHPQKHVWKRNTKFISKPCEDLKQFLKNNNINFYPEYSNPEHFKGHFYSIDIAFPNQKIAIEVNGNQHYNKNGTLAPKYQQRHDIIQNAGWKVIQIPYKKVYNQEVRQSILKLIKQNVNFTYDYRQQIKQFFKQKEYKYTCPICGNKKKTKYSKCCDKCKRKQEAEQKRALIPSKQQLIKDKEELHSYSAIGRKYNKTCNAIRRWFNKVYNLS